MRCTYVSGPRDGETADYRGQPEVVLDESGTSLVGWYRPMPPRQDGMVRMMFQAGIARGPTILVPHDLHEDAFAAINQSLAGTGLRRVERAPVGYDFGDEWKEYRRHGE